MRLTISTTRAAGVLTAAVVAVQGHEVRLHISRLAEPGLADLVGRGTLDVDGYLGARTVELAAITDDVAEALDRPDAVIVVAETAGQRDIAPALAERLTQGVPILLAPGGVGGALELSGRLRGTAAAGVTIAETTGLMHIGSLGGPGEVQVRGVKRDLPVGYFPVQGSEPAQALFGRLFPDLSLADNVLVTSLANTNTLAHGPVSILNAGMIESQRGNFPYFTQAFSPGAGRLVDAVDRERVRLLVALGLPPISGLEWFRQFYGDQGIQGSTILEMLSTFGPFQKVLSPTSLQHPYFSEDVPFGLVPIASLARTFDAPAEATEATITLCSIVCGQDFWATGRTVETLGLAGYSVSDLHALVENGWPAL